MKNENPIDGWWRWIRPYWHVGSFLVIVTFIAASNWSKVQEYNDRILALEGWRVESSREQNQQGQDIAVMKQQVNDIHDYLIPKQR